MSAVMPRSRGIAVIKLNAALMLIALAVTPLGGCAIFGRCAGAYSADMDFTGPGHETPEAAVVAWIEEGNLWWVSAEGWTYEDAVSGVMHASGEGGRNLELLQTDQGGWEVTALWCD